MNHVENTFTFQGIYDVQALYLIVFELFKFLFQFFPVVYGTFLFHLSRPKAVKNHSNTWDMLLITNLCTRATIMYFNLPWKNCQKQIMSLFMLRTGQKFAVHLGTFTYYLLIRTQMSIKLIDIEGLIYYHLKPKPILTLCDMIFGYNKYLILIKNLTKFLFCFKNEIYLPFPFHFHAYTPYMCIVNHLSP